MLRTRPMRRLILAAACTAAGTLATAAPASAVYEAAFVEQCCYLTLEQGDTAEQFLVFKNTGTEPWFREGAIPVNLGATNPMDRASPFYTPGDWLSPGRLTALDPASVPPGQNGRFTWIATAPQQTGTYREAYSPLAEGVTWMAQGTYVYLDYTVIAAQAPTVKFTATPARVEKRRQLRRERRCDRQPLGIARRLLGRIAGGHGRRPDPGHVGLLRHAQRRGARGRDEHRAGSRVRPRRARVGGLLGVRGLRRPARDRAPDAARQPSRRTSPRRPAAGAASARSSASATSPACGPAAASGSSARRAACAASTSHAKPRPADVRA